MILKKNVHDVHDPLWDVTKTGICLFSGHVRFINIQAWLRPRLSGQKCKFFKFVLLSILKSDLDTKKTTPNIEV